MVFNFLIIDLKFMYHYNWYVNDSESFIVCKIRIEGNLMFNSGADNSYI